MSRGFDRVRSWRRLWAGALALPVFGLLWQSFFWLDHVSLVAKAGYAGITLLSALRPAYGLLAVAGLATLGGPIALLTGAPFQRTAEAIVVAFLVGWLVRRVARRESIFDPGDSLSAPIALFVLAIVASLVVVSAALQSATAPPWQYIRQTVDFLAHSYFDGISYETQNWPQAALLVEGALLVAAVVQLTRRRPELQLALARMIAIGVVGASLLTPAKMGIAFIQTSDARALLMRAITSLRLSVYISDVNAVGTHFVLVLPLIWALGRMAGRWRSAWLLGLVPVVVCLWLTGSRSAQFSILLVVAAAIAFAAGRRATVRIVAVGVALVLVVATVIAARPGPESSVVATLNNRWMFLQLSWDLLKQAPLFGIGIAEYYGRSAHLMPEGLRTLYISENAHNNFAQIGVELGLAGLGLFVWLFASAWRRVHAGLRVGGDPLLRGLWLGLAGAVLTFLTGHPLLIAAVAFSFWMVLALAVVRADTVASQDARAPMPAESSEALTAGLVPSVPWRRMIAFVALVIVLSVPFRMQSARDDMNLSRVRWGFATGAEDLVSHERYELAGPQATLFVPARAKSLFLSVSQPSADDPVELELRIDGRLANRITLADGFWRDMRQILPVTRAARPFRRVDLIVRQPGGDTPAPREAGESIVPRVRVRTIEVN